MRPSYLYHIRFSRLDVSATWVQQFRTRRAAQMTFSALRDEYNRRGTPVTMSLTRTRSTDSEVACLAVY